MTEAIELQPTVQFPNGKLACSIDEFAGLTDIGRSTLYEAIKDGSLIVRKRGARTVIIASDGMRWLNNLPVAKPRGADNGKEAT